MKFNRVLFFIMVFSLLFPCVLFGSDDRLPAGPHSHQQQVNFNDFIKELMGMQVDGSQQTIGFWLPTDFFVSFALQAGETDREKVEKEFAFLRKYILIMVAQQLEEEDGTKIAAKRGDVLSRVTLKMDNGEEFQLADNVPPKVESVVENAKRGLMKNGGLGKTAHILIFSATTEGWKTPFDTAKRNTLVLSLKDGNGFKKAQLTWKTPFDATNPVPPCSKCGEQLSPKWSYCPWCGNKLRDNSKK